MATNTATLADSLRQKVEEHQESKEGGRSASLDKVGQQWDYLEKPGLRLGWLTPDEDAKDREAFALPWAQLTDAQRAKMAARAERIESLYLGVSPRARTAFILHNTRQARETSTNGSMPMVTSISTS